MINENLCPYKSENHHFGVKNTIKRSQKKFLVFFILKALTVTTKKLAKENLRVFENDKREIDVAER